MNRDQALSKIKKCLALAKSGNETEAATAMRQAQALMREHGLAETDVHLAEVAEKRTRARSVAINRWDSLLAHTVADAFGCEHFSITVLLMGRTVRNRRDVCFVGLRGAAEVAAYAYDVLGRQCSAMREAHIRRQPKACKPITKTARGDQFAYGWVCAVRNLVERFAGTEQDQLLLETYMQQRHPSLQTVEPRNTAVGRNVRNLDLEAGFHAGKSANLARGIGQAASAGQIGFEGGAGNG